MNLSLNIVDRSNLKLVTPNSKFNDVTLGDDGGINPDFLNELISSFESFREISNSDFKILDQSNIDETVLQELNSIIGDLNFLSKSASKLTNSEDSILTFKNIKGLSAKLNELLNTLQKSASSSENIYLEKEFELKFKEFKKSLQSLLKANELYDTNNHHSNEAKGIMNQESFLLKIRKFLKDVDYNKIKENINNLDNKELEAYKQLENIAQAKINSSNGRGTKNITLIDETAIDLNVLDKENNINRLSFDKKVSSDKSDLISYDDFKNANEEGKYKQEFTKSEKKSVLESKVNTFNKISGDNKLDTSINSSNSMQFTESIKLKEQNNVRANNVNESIIKTVRLTGNSKASTATINLIPESLGQLNLKIFLAGNNVRLQIRAQSKEAMELIESKIVSLKEKLQEEGLKIDDLELSYDKEMYEYNERRDENFSRKEELENRKRYLQTIKNAANGEGFSDELFSTIQTSNDQIEGGNHV